jgi:hypothetical protein
MSVKQEERDLAIKQADEAIDYWLDKAKHSDGPRQFRECIRRATYAQHQRAKYKTKEGVKSK